MKAFKKLLALVLAVCMLIGMPLSLDVSAVRNGNNADMVFDWRQALLIPDEWNTGLASGRSFSLYFTGAVDIDTDQVGAIVGLVNSAGWAEMVAVNGWSNSTLSQWKATISRNENFGDGTTEKNNYVVTINDDVNANVNYNNLLSTLAAKTGLSLVVRLYDKTAGVDGYINGVTEGETVMKSNNRNAGLGTTGLGCNANGQVTTDTNSNGHDFRDMKVTIVEQNETPHLTYARYVDGTLTVNYSAGTSFGYAGNYVTPHYIRVANSDGLYVYTNGTDYKLENDESLDGYTVVGQWANPGVMSMEKSNGGTSRSWELNETQLAAYNACVAAADALNAAAGTNEYSVVLAVEEHQDTSDKVKEENGEALNNWYIDGLWNGSTWRPLVATHRGVGDNADRALAKIYTDNASILADCMTVESFTTVEREGQRDRIVVTFSDPVDVIPVASWIRVFNANGALMTHDTATKKLGGSGNHLQWKISGWQKASADGKKWIGNLDDTSYNCNTYDEIVAYAAGLTDANGKAATAENGYQIQLAFLDQTPGANSGFKPGGHVNGDKVINNIVSTNGKKLYANNQESSTEERAVANYVDSLQITGVNIYKDNLTVITFDRDIDIDAAITAINTTKIPTLWISAVKEIMTGANPVGTNNTDANHIQYQIGSAAKFGNATNKLLLTGGNWTDFTTKRDAFEAKYGIDVLTILHMQGGKADGVIPGFVGTDGTVLYNSCPKTASGYDGWAGRYMTPISDERHDVSIVGITPNVFNNSVVVEFSEPIKYNEAIGTNGNTRSQVAIARFYIADDGTMNLVEAGNANIPEAYRTLADGSNGVFQSYETGFSATDANGTKVNEQYSKYWTFYFAEGVVDGMVNYYADNNDVYDEHIGFGFAIYEDTSNIYPDQLTEWGYLDDFASASDANGKCRYLKCNSAVWGQRYFKAPTVAADSLVTATSAKIISDKVVQITFSEPVKEAAPDGWVSLRVTPGDNYLITKPGSTDLNTAYQTGSNAVNALVPVNPDSDGYSTVWNFNCPTNILDWANEHFFNDTTYADVEDLDLTFSIESKGDHKNNGVVPNLQNKDGMGIKASEWHRSMDGVYISIKNDPAFAEGTVALYNGESYTSIADAVEAAETTGGTIVMIRNDEYTGTAEGGINVPAGVTLDLNGKTLNMGIGNFVNTGYVIDSTEGDALIVIGQDTTQQFVQFHQDNPQLPLYDTANGGYRFYTTSVINKGTQGTGNYVKFGMHLDMTDFSLLAQEGNGGAKVVFRLATSELANVEGYIERELDATKLASYATSHTDNTVMFLGVSGMNNLQDPDALIVTARIESAGVWKDVTIAAIE